MTWFKALNGVVPFHGGIGRYPGKGRWTRHVGPLDPCRVGFHLALDGQILGWLAPTIWVAEPCPDHDPVDGDGKWVTCRVRLVERTGWDDAMARRFAADVAESVLLGERACGRELDERSWGAVHAGRAFADREPSLSGRFDVYFAAWDARTLLNVVGAAAQNASWAAARAAGFFGGPDDIAAYMAAWNTMGERLVAYLTGRPLPPVTALYGPPS